jgi:hypothetical protein
MSVSFLRVIADDFHPHHPNIVFVVAGLCASALMEPGSLIETARSLAFRFFSDHTPRYQPDSLLIPIGSWAFYYFILVSIIRRRERRAVARA